MVLSLVVASCGEAVVEEEKEEPKEEEKVTEEVKEEEGEEEPAEEEVVKETGPIYGGILTSVEAVAPGGWEHYYGSATTNWVAYGSPAFENFMTTDPDDWAFETRFTPPQYFSGDLAESWELSEDLKTMTMHVRKGVHWHDIPPVNGREHTAYDMEYSYQRLFGLGSGFTEKSTFVSTFLYGKIDSITATDKYTLEIKWPEPAISPAVMFLDVNTKVIAREVIELYGDANKWDRVVGTGPFMMEDYVADSMITFVKHPNYWGNDEHYPENQLPYIDELRILIIPDPSTRVSALRSGRIDVLRNMDWEDATNLLSTNPELEQYQFPGSAFTVVMPVDQEPWSDIRVRKAMQMSIDLDKIAETYFGGVVPGTPVSAITRAHVGFAAEYEDWPQEVKDGHAYNPEGAKALLAEAGYPDGFKTRLTLATSHDVDLAAILVSYFSVIGIDMELDLKETGAWRTYVRGGNTELAYPIWSDSATIPPQYHFPHFLPTYYENPMRGIDDPVINEKVAAARAASNWVDMARIIQETDMHVVSQFYNVRVLPNTLYTLYQPYIKRFYKSTSQPLQQAFARLWIDYEEKEAMGY